MIIDTHTDGRESSWAGNHKNHERSISLLGRDFIFIYLFLFYFIFLLFFSYLDGEEGTGSFRGRPAHLTWIENADQHFTTPFDRLQGGGRRGVVVVVLHRLDLPEDLGRDSAHLYICRLTKLKKFC